MSKVKYPAGTRRLYAVGKGSLPDLHSQGKIWKGAYLAGLYIEKRSHWDKGKSFKIHGIAEIAEAIGYSGRHVRRCLEQLEAVGWLKRVSEPGAEYLLFEMYPFGEAARKERQTTAAPLDDTDPLALLGRGEISRAECIAWHYLNVGWQERLGETVARSLREWAKHLGLSARTLWQLFLPGGSRLFQRISKKTHATVLKVFPFLEKAEVKTDRRALNEAEIQASYGKVIFTDDGTAMYRGEQYRASGEGFEIWTEAIGTRFAKWIFVTDRVPPQVKAAFDA